MKYCINQFWKNSANNVPSLTAFLVELKTDRLILDNLVVLANTSLNDFLIQMYTGANYDHGMFSQI